MDITVYTFEDEHGTEMNFSTQDVKEAREYAQANECIAIDNTYVWDDSEPVTAWDFRPVAEDEGEESCTTETPCSVRAMQGGLSCDHA